MIRLLHHLVSLLLLAGTINAQDAPPLEGLWEGSARRTAPGAGAMTLTRTRERWQLETTAGAAVASTIDGQVRIEIPRVGVLRFRVREGVPAGRATWEQPPGNAGYGFATPVVLQRQRAGRWRGTIRPLAERATLTMRVWPGTDGQLLARFRNPEFGWNLGRTFTVEARDSTIVLRDPASGAVRFTQPYRAARGEVEFDFGEPFVLTRRPGAPRRAPVSVETPPRRDDGWAVGSAAAAGFDVARLRRVIDTLLAADPFSDSTILLHSLHIARGNRLVVEQFANGHEATRLHDTRSAFKTFIGVMAGAAIGQGAPLSPDTPAIDLLGAEWPVDDPRREIRLRHLLTHTSGLACDDNDAQSPGNEEVMQRQRSQPDWARYQLALASSHPAGTHYAYCSGGMHLAATMVARATGQWLPAFFDQAIAQPLQFGSWAMNLTPNGEGYGGGGAYLLARDLLKLGQLALDHGRWQGRQVVPAAFMDLSLAHHAVTPDGGSDGLGWHRHVVRAAGRDWQEVEANGNGGQMVMVIPELQLVVGVLAGNYNRYGTWRRLRSEVLPSIIESIRR